MTVSLCRKLMFVHFKAYGAEHETASFGIAVNSRTEQQTLIRSKLIMPAIAGKHLFAIDPQTCALRYMIESQLISMRMSNVSHSGKLDFL